MTGTEQRVLTFWNQAALLEGRAEVVGLLVGDDRARVVMRHDSHEIVEKADVVGSTEMIIRTLDAAPTGSSWAVGTELNLVRRLADRHPDKQIVFLEKTVCYCSTMNRIDLPHLVWSLESLVRVQVVNRITVEQTVAANARVALDRMLALP